MQVKRQFQGVDFDGVYDSFGKTVQEMTDASDAMDDVNSLMSKANSASAATVDEDDLAEELRQFLEADSTSVQASAPARPMDVPSMPRPAKQLRSGGGGGAAATASYRKLGIDLHSA